MATVTQPVKEAYIFSRNDTTAIRLNYQHWLAYRLCGWLLHPSIPRDGPGLRVADVGTGSGIWAMEIFDELPKDTRIDALDINDSQYPASVWVRENIHFSTHDCFKRFPEELVEKFDIVNIRFFLTSITPGSLEPFLRNCMKLLKPGGHIQWYEPDMETTKVTTGSLSFPTPAVDKLVAVMKKPTPDSDHTFVSSLGETYTQQGLELVKLERMPMKDHLRPLFCHTQIMGYEAMCEKLEEQGMSEQAEQAREHVLEIRREFQKGAALAQDFVCCVGRKPAE